jgi:uncharacterized protein involved in high-affinity Fe2+ transport
MYLANLLIEHTVPQYWFSRNVLEPDQEDELNHHSDADTGCSQFFAYMLEER